MFRIQTILIVLLAFVAPSGAQSPQQPAESVDAPVIFRTGVSDVRVVVQVVENGKVLKGLTKSDFVVTDRGEPQPVIYFGREQEPLDLVLLLDISGSMRKHIQQMSETATDALRHLSPGDRVAVMTFGVRTNLHVDFFDNHAEVARRLRTAVDDQEIVGYGTEINNAVMEASRLFEEKDSSGRRAILIVTDNLGLNYRANDSMSIAKLHNADAMLNAIVVGRGTRPGPPRAGDNPDFTAADVFKLAEATGGETVKADRAASFFPEMVARIRDRYTLAYRAPEGGKAGEYRAIRVALTPEARALYPRAEVLARSGYYVKP